MFSFGEGISNLMKINASTLFGRSLQILFLEFLTLNFTVPLSNDFLLGKLYQILIAIKFNKFNLGSKP